jgi:hypothetical protein
VICGCHSSGIGVHDDQFVVVELVVEAVFVGDMPRPLVGQAMGQALGRAEAVSSIMRLIRLRLVCSLLQVM